VQNPFEGIRKTQDIEPVYALPREIIQRIWGDLPKLRDGDSHTSYSGLGTKDRKKRPKFEFKSFSKIDFRKPYPASYAAILLAFGAGLRANEIDKARWSWFMFNDKGECLIVIKPEFDFKPKGGSARAIKIPTEVHQALVATRTDLTSAYVLGGEETTAETLAHGEGYRRKDVMTIANTWLRLRGVENNSRYGNPLHRLRKQFGSTVATEFGLFAAQKYLGHTSPTVTAKYYAAQTELPELTHVQLLG
jgi:integrase